MKTIKSICKRFCTIILSGVQMTVGLIAMLLLTSLTANAETADDIMEINSPAENAEKHLIIDSDTQQWISKHKSSNTQGPKTEVKKELVQKADTVKLENVVPPIPFKSGQADILVALVELNEAQNVWQPKKVFFVS